MIPHLFELMERLPVYGWPLKTSAAAYDQAIESYLAGIPKESTKGVIKIGSVSHAGISDIDLVVVLKAGSTSSFRRYKASVASSQYKHLLIHDPWLIDELTLERFGLLFPFFSCEPLMGNVQLPSISPLHIYKKELSLLHLSDSLLTKLPRELIFNFIVARRIHARFALVLASTVRHSARLLIEAGDHAWAEIDSFCVRVDQLRADTIAGGRDANSLRKVVAEAIKLSYEMVIRTQALWKRALDNTKAAAAKYRGYYHTVVDPEWTPESSLEYSLTTSGRLYRSVRLPTWVAWYLSLLGCGDNLFAEHIRRKLKPYPNVAAPLGIEVATREMAQVKSDYISFGLRALNYAGALAVTHGCGEPYLYAFARSLLKAHCLVVKKTYNGY